jgi:hypothetical protein
MTAAEGDAAEPFVGGHPLHVRTSDVDVSPVSRMEDFCVVSTIAVMPFFTGIPSANSILNDDPFKTTTSQKRRIPSLFFTVL